MTDLAETTSLVDPPSDAAVYAALAPELTRFATALVGPGDAADVLSTAVVKALASPTWPAITNRRAYLYRAVFNAAQTHRRRRRLHLERDDRAASSPHWDLPNLHPEVRAAVRQLSVRQRAVIVLTYWADMDPGGVADHLGISDGAVRRHLARARSRLREALNERP
jgi:RNA polymerase sigma-70 factor (ECF subfamily)